MASASDSHTPSDSESSVLVVGGTRGLGAELVKQYAAQDGVRVYATTRGSKPPGRKDGFPEGILWLTKVDLLKENVGIRIQEEVNNVTPEFKALDTVIITAGVFEKELFHSEDDPPDWKKEQQMYTTSAIAPVFIIKQLVAGKIILKGGKVILVSSEAGSITLRHLTEGGGNYGHHGSKAALNMVGKLLSMDLRELGIIVSIVHPGFMRTDMTKGVGFDEFWDSGGAVTPAEAAQSLIEWTRDLNMDDSGQFWAPRGSGDIGTWQQVTGASRVNPGPLLLPW